MLDHVTLRVADFAASRKFYDSALAPLGIRPLYMIETSNDRSAGYGQERPFFWIGVMEDAEARGTAHVAFAARSRRDVEAFHAAALAAGGRDNGAPGLRPQYHPTYYGAFVLDPDGNNIEAVHHGTPLA
jgi:catechol 2,3-dioxygenase-like lactoylglutathione lyase family enzyme